MWWLRYNIHPNLKNPMVCHSSIHCDSNKTYKLPPTSEETLLMQVQDTAVDTQCTVSSSALSLLAIDNFTISHFLSVICLGIQHDCFRVVTNIAILAYRRIMRWLRHSSHYKPTNEDSSISDVSLPFQCSKQRLIKTARRHRQEMSMQTWTRRCSRYTAHHSCLEYTSLVSSTGGEYISETNPFVTW